MQIRCNNYKLIVKILQQKHINNKYKNYKNKIINYNKL